MRFVLASASQGRYDTLTRAGVRPERIVSSVDEDGISAPTVVELVQLLADLKARDVADRLDGAVLVLGCDSMLEFDGEALGKPRSIDDARTRWRRMRGRSGVLHTGHCLVDRGRGESHQTTSTTVRFADVSDDDIELYLATGEPTSVAGAFTIDGLGGWFIDKVDGDPHTVVGLSLPLLRGLLHKHGYTLGDLGYPSA